MLDREKVIKGLEEISDYFFNVYHRSKDREEINNAKDRCDAVEDALALLKEQEAVKPYIDIDEAKCPICKVKLTRQELLGDDVLFEDFFDYCPHCGKPVLWEGR